MINNLPCQAHRSLLHPHVLLLWLESAQVIMMMMIKIMKMMMTTLMATIMVVMMTMMSLCRGPAPPADSPAVPTPRGLDPIALDRWVGQPLLYYSFICKLVKLNPSFLSLQEAGKYSRWIRKACRWEPTGWPKVIWWGVVCWPPAKNVFHFW